MNINNLNSLYLFGRSGLNANQFQQPSMQNISGHASLHTLRENGLIPKINPPTIDNQHDTLELSSTAMLLQKNALAYSAENFENILKNWLKDALNETGIDLQDNDSLEIGLNESGQMTVSGLKNDSDNLKLAEALNKISAIPAFTGGIGGNKDFSTGVSKLQVWTQRMFYRDSDWAMSADNEFERDNRANLIYMKNNASRYAEEYTGIALDYSQLYRTEDGKIAGYPQELAWYFETEIAKPGIYKPTNPTKEEGYVLSMRYYANAFLDAGYDNIPDVETLNRVFRFEKSDLT
jgi:hypothetical protein